MSDPIVPEPTPSTPPVAPAAPVYAAVPVVGKRALSLTSFILGLVGVILFWTNWFALVIGIVAVVLGFVAKARETTAPRWMWLVGIIAGFVAIVLGGIVLIVVLAVAAALRNAS